MDLSIKVHNRLLDLSSPKVMAILNITPDSFHTACGHCSDEDLLGEVQTMLDQGADIIDIGACSTRPHSTPASEEEEWDRLSHALQLIRAAFPDTILSIDTFRANIAEKAIQMGADIINDVYGGDADRKIWDVVAQYRVPYILTHAQEIASSSAYDSTISQIIDFFQSRLDTLHRMGVADVIVDPGFGFAKTLEQNYAILRQLDILSTLRAPVLIGVSRKSMLYKPLELTPADVLPATTAAHTIALQQGAHILRVHDVSAAKQAIHIHQLMQNS